MDDKFTKEESEGINEACKAFEKMNREQKIVFLDWLSGNFCATCGEPVSSHNLNVCPICNCNPRIS